MISRSSRVVACAFLLAMFVLVAAGQEVGKEEKIAWTPQEQPIATKIDSLESVPEASRWQVFKELNQQIRALPAGDHKVTLADELAGWAGFFDTPRDILQELANTIAEALRESPLKLDKDNSGWNAYKSLAVMAHYDKVSTSLDHAEYRAAIAAFAAADEKARTGDFQSKDLKGQAWSFTELRGKVVLLNFWAPWCTPCTKELADLESLHREYKDRGLIVLGIANDEDAKVKAFLAKRDITYSMLLDSAGDISKRFGVKGIPRTFVYDREGKLVAPSFGVRTRKQFLEMLAEAGLK